MFKELPLFPLNTMVFPDGILPLRIFEPRYISMVSDCMKNHKPFVVVLIQAGNEGDKHSFFHQLGTLMQIIDFDQLDDGLLGVTCRGLTRGRVIASWTESNGLVMGSVQKLEAQTAQLLQDKYQTMSDFLRETLELEELKAYREGLIEDWDNQTWLSYRLAELLPLSQSKKQSLLEVGTVSRLNQLQSVMLQSNLISSTDDIEKHD